MQNQNDYHADNTQNAGDEHPKESQLSEV